jgi:hypothetical protein
MVAVRKEGALVSGGGITDPDEDRILRLPNFDPWLIKSFPVSLHHSIGYRPSTNLNNCNIPKLSTPFNMNRSSFFKPNKLIDIVRFTLSPICNQEDRRSLPLFDLAPLT